MAALPSASPRPAAPLPAPPDTTLSVGLRVAGVLVDDGVLTAGQLALASHVHKKVAASRTLPSVLIELKLATEAQIRGALRTGKVDAPLGEVLVELGRLEAHELQLALAQKREHPQTPVADILVDSHFAERRRHQDGRIQYETWRGTVDIRVSPASPKSPV